jgi:hypothetical protein
MWIEKMQIEIAKIFWLNHLWTTRPAGIRLKYCIQKAYPQNIGAEQFSRGFLAFRFSKSE